MLIPVALQSMGTMQENFELLWEDIWTAIKETLCSALGVPSPLCILELSWQIHIEWQSKHNYIYVIYKVLVYVQTS